MNIPISILLMIGYLSIASSLPTSEVLKQDLADSIQTKRDLSVSYAATDIGSKEGTRVKTITVIKNVDGKKQQPLKINPKLHKSEEWGSYFRDNFDAYGVIPDVPDIDDLFEFVNKKDDKKAKEKVTPKKTDEKDKKIMKDDEESKKENKTTTTTSSPPSVEEVSTESPSDENVEKITGDAELIQTGGKQGKVKSQSLDLGKYSVRESNTFDVSYSTPHSSDPQFISNSDTRGSKNEKYIQSPSDSYYYPQPGFGSSNAFPSGNSYTPQPQAARGSISVTTPSGKKYDIPFGNVTDIPPYIAPNFRRNQNSPSGQNFATSSQRPYIAPNVRKSYDVQLNNTNAAVNRSVVSNPLSNRQQPPNNVYSNIPASFRTGSYKPNLPRSRGLRY